MAKEKFNFVMNSISGNTEDAKNDITEDIIKDEPMKATEEPDAAPEPQKQEEETAPKPVIQENKVKPAAKKKETKPKDKTTAPAEDAPAAEDYREEDVLSVKTRKTCCQVYISEEDLKKISYLTTKFNLSFSYTAAQMIHEGLKKYEEVNGAIPEKERKKNNRNHKKLF